jgi:hypothetical protein
MLLTTRADDHVEAFAGEIVWRVAEVIPPGSDAAE